MHYHIILVDPDSHISSKFSGFLNSKYSVKVFQHPFPCLKAFEKTQFPVLFSQLKLEPISGLELFERVEKLSPKTEKFLILNEIHNDIEKIQYPVIPVDKLVNEEYLYKIEDWIQNAINKFFTDNGNSTFENFAIIGSSKAFLEVVKLARSVANSSHPVLITGETGTGKNLLAKYIHLLSERRNGPFRTLNCPSISPNLFEAEIFGYVKGAFTGANITSSGHLSMADGGTFVLDEIAEIDLKFQAKLLHVIEEQLFFPVGSRCAKKVNTRIIALTNKNLERLVEEGKFRKDLYYRLNKHSIYIPPLRERPDDIVDLTKFIVRRILEERGYELYFSIDKDALDYLQGLKFPGNVRDLHNLILKIIYKKNNRRLRITLHDFYNVIENSNRFRSGNEPLPHYLMRIEREKIVEALLENDLNVTKTAKILGVTRQNLQYRMKRLKIDKDTL